WTMPYILRIDPSNGQVLGKADVSDIWQRVKQIDPQVDVPNGIAYDSVTKKIFITGKRWPKLFEVQFGN
ncbi:MAG: glutaminyl-peptide cyclotransferase, partial [Chitinophagaceae bacterium]|nr:glutaminyl-peptide cyclotransferase [Chitinophagaceae bacterium]